MAYKIVAGIDNRKDALLTFNKNHPNEPINQLYKSFLTMTKSEWSAAESVITIYFIYRLMIDHKNIRLFIIQDTVGKYKSNLLSMTITIGGFY